MSNDRPHGALGSNQKLERVPVEEPVKKEIKEETTPDSPVPLQEPEEKDVVYLREDLRPGQAF
jgi:hypothetical protein